MSVLLRMEWIQDGVVTVLIHPDENSVSH